MDRRVAQDSLGASKPALAEESFSSVVGSLRAALSNLSPEEQRDLDSLGHEKDVEIFWADLCRLGFRLQRKEKVGAAATIYVLVKEQSSDAETRRKAQTSLDAIEGRGNIGDRAEFLLSHFVKDASDPQMILPMLAGTAVYQLAKGAALGRMAAATSPTWWMRGAPGRLSAAGLAYAAEVPTFALLGRTMRGLSSNAAQQLGLGQELGSAALTLGVLKLAGAGSQALMAKTLGQSTAPWTRLAVSQGTMFVGLLSSHRLEAGLGLRSHAPNDATEVTDILSSLVSLGLGANLGHKLLGRTYTAKIQELDFRIRQSKGGLNSEHMVVSRGLAPVEAPVWMMSKEYESEGRGPGFQKEKRRLMFPMGSRNFTRLQKIRDVFFEEAKKKGATVVQRSLDELKEDDRFQREWPTWLMELQEEAGAESFIIHEVVLPREKTQLSSLENNKFKNNSEWVFLSTLVRILESELRLPSGFLFEKSSEADLFRFLPDNVLFHAPEKIHGDRGVRMKPVPDILEREEMELYMRRDERPITISPHAFEIHEADNVPGYAVALHDLFHVLLLSNISVADRSLRMKVYDALKGYSFSVLHRQQETLFQFTLGELLDGQFQDRPHLESLWQFMVSNQLPKEVFLEFRSRLKDEFTEDLRGEAMLKVFADVFSSYHGDGL